MTITLPITTVSETNVREHWARRAQRAKTQRSDAHWALMAAWGRSRRRPPREGAIVILTRLAPRRLDGDNLQAALKAVRDGVADALGINDGDARVTWRYGQERARQYGVRVTVEAITEGGD